MHVESSSLSAESSYPAKSVLIFAMMQWAGFTLSHWWVRQDAGESTINQENPPKSGYLDSLYCYTLVQTYTLSLPPGSPPFAKISISEE